MLFFRIKSLLTLSSALIPSNLYTFIFHKNSINLMLVSKVIAASEAVRCIIA